MEHTTFAMVWHEAQAFLRRGFWNDPGAWHVGSRSHGEEVGNFSSWPGGCTVLVGAPIYWIADQERYNPKIYDKDVMQVTGETFQKWANQLSAEIIDNEWIEHKVWIVTAPFCR